MSRRRYSSLAPILFIVLAGVVLAPCLVCGGLASLLSHTDKPDASKTSPPFVPPVNSQATAAPSSPPRTLQGNPPGADPAPVATPPVTPPIAAAAPSSEEPPADSVTYDPRTKTERVSGYINKNGTYVAPYTRRGR